MRAPFNLYPPVCLRAGISGGDLFEIVAATQNTQLQKVGQYYYSVCRLFGATVVSLSGTLVYTSVTDIILPYI